MPLIAYDADGNVVATLDKLVVRDDDGKPALVDFAAHEASGARLRDIWEASDAIRSTVEHRDAGRRKGPPRSRSALPLVGRSR
jgi:hypothetical protein